MKDRIKPKYNAAQNVGWMVKIAWKVRKRVLFICVAMAALEVLYNLTEAITIGASLLESFMPETSQKILAQLQVEKRELKDMDRFGLYPSGNRVTDKPEILFARMDIKEVMEKVEAMHQAEAAGGETEAGKEAEAGIDIEANRRSPTRTSRSCSSR